MVWDMMNSVHKDSGDHPGVYMADIIYSFGNSRKALGSIRRTVPAPLVLRLAHLSQLTTCCFDQVCFLSFRIKKSKVL